jgi:hypothetical protein
MLVGAHVNVLHFTLRRACNKTPTAFVFPVPGGPHISLTGF